MDRISNKLNFQDDLRKSLMQINLNKIKDPTLEFNQTEKKELQKLDAFNEHKEAL